MTDKEAIKELEEAIRREMDKHCGNCIYRQGYKCTNRGDNFCSLAVLIMSARKER